MKNTTATQIAEIAIEATQNYEKYWETREAYIASIRRADIDDMRVYADMGDIEATDEDLAQALEIYKTDEAFARMINEEAEEEEIKRMPATKAEEIQPATQIIDRGDLLYGNADDVQAIIAQAEEALQNGDPTEAYRLACLANKTYNGMSSAIEWAISSILCKSSKAVEACR